jgi:L-lactate dehydrogenase complex protein LldE
MPKHTTVTLFVQCLVDALHPEAGEAMVRVLERLGCALDYPAEQTCCGQPAFNAGFRRDAAKAARHCIEVFEPAAAVVCPSGSCVNMVRRHYPELFAHDPRWLGRARALAAKTWEFTEFLVDVAGVADLGAAYAGTVTYHDSCHLARGLGIRRQPRLLLENVAGLTLVEMADSDACCGFGGSFSVKFPELSEAVLEDKVQSILATGAGAVVGCDLGCLLNIEGMLHRRGHAVRALHIAQVLAGTGAEGDAA